MKTHKAAERDSLQKDLELRAVHLRDAGYTLVAIGPDKAPAHRKGYLEQPQDQITERAVALVRAGRVTGLALLLGSQGAREAEDGGVRITLALEHEGRASTNDEFMTSWDEAVDLTGSKAVMDRLTSGWVEDTPSGGRRWFFQMYFDEETEAATALEHIKGAARAAKRDGETYAEILTSLAVVAPSGGVTHKSGQAWTSVHGGPDDAPTLEVDELYRIADVILHVGEVGPGSNSDASIAELAARDDRTFYARAQYNKHLASTASTVAVLKSAGWAVTKKTSDGTVVMDKDGHAEVRISGPDRPDGALYTFSTSAFPLEGFETAFDIRVKLEPKWNGNPTRLAEHLLSQGEVEVRDWSYAPRDRPRVNLDKTPSHQLATTIARNITRARHPAQRDIPFVLRHAPGGAIEGASLVSLSRDGAMMTWAPNRYGSLALAVVQPSQTLKDGRVKNLHTVPPAVVDTAIHTVMSGAAVATVSHISFGPCLVDTGDVVSTPGHHPEHGVLVAMPRKERAWWRAGYKVPKALTPDDPQRAFDYLCDELLVDFPFAGPQDLASAAAYLLTCVGRNLFPTAPAWLFTAPDRGTGKTKLAVLGRIVATGRTTAQSVGYARRDDEESKKSYVTAAQSGTRFLHVDELPRGDRVTSTALSELITAPDGAYTLRVLGGNQVQAIGGMVVTVCGNNSELGGDMNRRFIPIHLEHQATGMAHERDGFRHEDLEAWATASRPSLLAACHTILAWGLRNPATALPKGLGSFEAWKRVVLGALSHVTIDGKQASELMLEGRAEWEGSQDEEADEWLPLMKAAFKRFDGKWASASQWLGMVVNSGSRVALPAVLVQQVGAGRAGETRAWGRRLQQRAKTRVRDEDGSIYHIEVLRDAKRGHQYRVVLSSEPASNVAPLRKVPDLPTPVANESPVEKRLKTARTRSFDEYLFQELMEEEVRREQEEMRREQEEAS